ncbi:MAG TPA: alpha/beta hydrolase [Albitalea sp.]|nr:alpha/beta hydrolase [Albitalea sp.]
MSTWVLLRGLTRESRHWGGFAATLREQLPNANVVTLDLPGNGRLNAMRSLRSVEEMAAFCRAELRHRALPPPYHLLAMSLGAMVAVAWAQRHPQELAGCVLINTSLRPFSPFTQRLRPASVATLVKLMLFERDDRQWEEAILRLTTRHAGDGVIDEWLALRRERPVSRANALRQLWAAARFSALPAAPAPPLLVLASAKDALVDPRCSRRLASRWGAALAEHASAGHDLPLDDGPWVAQQVRDWLTSR